MHGIGVSGVQGGLGKQDLGLGETITNSQKFFQRYNEATIKPNGILGFINHYFSYKAITLYTLQ